MAASLIASMASLLIQPVASSLIGKGQEGGFLPLLVLPLMIKVLGKGDTRAGRKYNNMDKNF